MPQNITPQRRRQNTRLYIVQAAVEYHIALLLTGSFLAALTTRLGMPDALTGILSSVISLGCVFQLLSMLLRPRRSRRFIVSMSVVNQLLFASLYFLPFLPGSDRMRIALFVVLILSAYFVYNVAHPAKVSWLMHWVGDGVRGMFTANMQIFSLLTGMVFSLAMGAVSDHFREKGQQDTAFLLCGVTILVLMLVHAALLRGVTDWEPVPQACGNMLSRFTDVLRQREVRHITVLYTLWSVANYAAIPFYGTYQIKELGFSLTLVSALSILGCLIRALVSRAWGSFGDRRSFPVMVRGAFVVAAISFAVCAFAAPGRGWVPFALYNVAYGIALGGIENGRMNLIFDVVEEEKRADALALSQSVYGLAGFLSTVVFSAAVNAVQSAGNTVLGMPLYAQQIMSVAAALLSLAAAVYAHTVLVHKR